MLTTGKRPTFRKPKIIFQTMDQWAKGLYTRLDSDRIPSDGVRVAENVRLDQNGTITPRPGLRLYGVQPTGTVIGQIYEFVRLNGTTPETYNIWMENRSGTGTVIYSKDGGAHNVATGKTYDITGSPHFEQVFGKVLITNGVDTLSYLDVQTFAITAFTALTTPTGGTATASGVSGSTYNLRYRVTATSTVGETAASTAATVGLSKLRESWTGTTEFVTFTWNRVSGAKRYNIYVGDQAGFEYFIDTVSDIGSGTTQSYVDTGATAETTTRIAPVGDSTSGPRTTRATNIKGQIYMVGDTDNPGRIWFGGAGDSALDFSSFNGGGWVEPNKGGKDFPSVVKPFRDGKGTPTAVAFSKGTNGTGKRYLLQPATTTVGSTVISYMSVMEDNGQDGTDSPDGVVMLNDAAWYPSRSGFKTTNTKAQIQNILSTDNISDNISPNVNNLSSKYMESCVGIAYDQVIYWSLPYSSTKNNQIWLLDLRQRGSWMQPWYISCDWMWLYAENSTGNTKFLMLSNNKFYQVDDNNYTNDEGISFQTSVGSGEIKFGENNEFASVLDVTFEFLRPQGNIGLTVNVDTEDGIIPFGDTLTSTANETVSGWGRFGWGGSGWGQLANNLIGVDSSEPRRSWKIEIDEECSSLNWTINTNGTGINYQLSKVIVRYVPIGFKDLDNI